MPAVTPAEVKTCPSRVKMGSGSTRTVGYRAANWAQRDQWVVARRPSSSPASASRNAPVHTDVTRRAVAASRRRWSASAPRAPGSASSVWMPSPAGHHEGVEGTGDLGQGDVGSDARDRSRCAGARRSSAAIVTS